jgi:hypothetical protein
MFEGAHFSSDDPDLDTYVRELDERISALFPELSNGVAAARLRTYSDQLAGHGVSLAEGYLPSKDTVLAMYVGRVVPAWTSGEYVLALPPFRRKGRSWHLSVDAGARYRGGNPSPANVALFNHSCHDATVVLRRPVELRDCAVPCAAAYPSASLRTGGKLLWDYDGGARAGNAGFTVDHAGRADLELAGINTNPCLCRRPDPCPRGRWFRIFPDAHAAPA